MRPFIGIAAAFAAAAAFAPAARAQDCPRDTIALYTSSPVAFTAAAADTALGARTARYDLRAGTLSIQHPGTLVSMSLVCRDRYRVTGLPAGTPVAVTALFDVDGYTQTAGCGGTGCYGTFGAGFSDGQTSLERNVTATFYAGRFPLLETLAIPVQALAGEDFELRMSLWYLRPAGASHWGGGTGRVRFGGLPAGAAVVSCQGYDSVVPARHTTWGRVKSIYR